MTTAIINNIVISIAISSDSDQDEIIDRYNDEDSDDNRLVKPINEIFICFDQEEYFEGDLSNENGENPVSNFDIIEHMIL